ncbi:MAG TPA: hypothetical protein PKV31_09795, partial [Saprospiraceae bacterium]|nr:hypothetical protein [Saprospiraceae bacterium]
MEDDLGTEVRFALVCIAKLSVVLWQTIGHHFSTFAFNAGLFSLTLKCRFAGLTKMYQWCRVI